MCIEGCCWCCCCGCCWRWLLLKIHSQQSQSLSPYRDCRAMSETPRLLVNQQRHGFMFSWLVVGRELRNQGYPYNALKGEPRSYQGCPNGSSASQCFMSWSQDISPTSQVISFSSEDSKLSKLSNQVAENLLLDLPFRGVTSCEWTSWSWLIAPFTKTYTSILAFIAHHGLLGYCWLIMAQN